MNINRLSKKQYVGLILFMLPCLFALFAPIFVDGDANKQSLMNTLNAPSHSYWLGTDHLGRDMWLRLAAALRVSLGIAFLSMFISTLLGTLLGVLSAQYPHYFDNAINLLVNMVLAIPGLLLVLLLATLSPGQLWPLFLGIALITSIEMYRVVRADALKIANTDAVAASKLLGFGPLYLLYRHYFPVLRPVIFRLSAFSLASTILSIAALGFVNVGVKPPRAELGLMMTELLPYYSEAPWAVMQPIVTLFLLVFGLNLLIGRRA